MFEFYYHQIIVKVIDQKNLIKVKQYFFYQESKYFSFKNISNKKHVWVRKVIYL